MENRKGRFTASNISRLLAGGTGKTAQSYCLELAMDMIGLKKSISTIDMQHGIVNQHIGFEQVIEPLYEGVKWYDEYIAIDERCGASPDFILEDNFVGDIKCPGYIDTFLEQIEKAPTKYYQQVQMQMMAAKVDTGLLCIFLTKKEEWGSDEVWHEYPMPLIDRYKIHEFKTDAEVQDSIMTAVDKYEPIKQNIYQALVDAPAMDEVEFFYSQINGSKYRNVKDASNIISACESRLIQVNSNFYYKSK